MFNFILNYITYLDRLTIQGIVWLIEQDVLYQAIMCTIPLIATFINFVRNRIIEEVMREDDI